MVMEYTIDFSELNRINDEFFGINTEKEEIVEYNKEDPVDYKDPYKDKIDLCMDFEQKMIDSLSNIYKDDNELEQAKTTVKSFMSDFINAKEFDNQSENDLNEYFKFISSILCKMNNEEINHVLNLLKSKDYASVQDVIDSVANKEDKR